jgi:hypothetical protein
MRMIKPNAHNRTGTSRSLTTRIPIWHKWSSRTRTCLSQLLGVSMIASHACQITSHFVLLVSSHFSLRMANVFRSAVSRGSTVLGWYAEDALRAAGHALERVSVLSVSLGPSCLMISNALRPAQPPTSAIVLLRDVPAAVRSAWVAITLLLVTNVSLVILPIKAHVSQFALTISLPLRRPA